MAAMKAIRSYEKLIINSDGAARGNPGPAGAGAAIQTSSGDVVAEVSEYLGETTNNVAEYKALILALERAREFAAPELEIRADSELMVKQLKGEYKVKNEGLKPLFAQAKGLISAYRRVNILHVYRAQNKLADELANEAIDQRNNRATAGQVGQNQTDDTANNEQGTLF